MGAAKQWFIACLLWVFMSASFAEEGATLLSDEQEDEIINLAYSQLKASIEELEKNIDQCEILARKNVLDAALFQSLLLTDQEKRIAISYLSYMAQSECEDTRLWANIHLEYAQFKDIEKYYKGKNIIKTDIDLEIICCMISRRYFESKWKYLKIAPDVRKKLERMPELQKPFDVIQTVKTMGLL
ncbi:MAG TPA: hypothetical protein ENI94_01650 [Gammaproteobacteria bacterium]|nr:hypothetical protein [Gammaproteobacteria bacterium]